MRAAWNEKALEEICDFENGLWTGKKPPYINAGVIRNTNFTKDCRLDDSYIVYLDVEQSRFAKRKLQYGDIILEKSGGGPKQPVGRVVIFDKKKGDFSFSNFTTSIRIKDKKEIDFNYLHRFLLFEYISGATEKMQSNSTGIRNLKFDEYKKIKIAYPTLAEQKRIVAILDDTLAALDKARENVEKNLQNTKELFESYLESIFSNDETWEEKKLGDDNIIEIIDGDRGTNYPKQNEFHNNGYCVFLNTGNVRKNGFDFSDVTFITKEKDEKLRKGKLQRNDVVMTTRGTIGNIGLYHENVPFDHMRINSGMLIFRPNTKLIYPGYLFEVFRSRKMKTQIKKFVSGSAQPQLPVRTLVNFTFLLPKSIERQKEIVRDVQLFSKTVHELEKGYAKKLLALEELKKSCLQKAFTAKAIEEIIMI
jgi:type I restriction enzyme, S subunit